MTGINDLESALAALRHLPDDPASEEQAARILSRRAAGDRITLPSRARSRPYSVRSLTIAAVALAAGISGVMLLRPAASGPGHEAPLFAASDLMAQPTSRPEFPILSASPRPLKPAEWFYDSDPLEQIRPWDHLFAFRVERSRYRGAAAWMLLAGSKAPDSTPIYTDTTWAARDGLALLGHERDTTVTVQPIPSMFLAVLQSADLSSDWSASIPLRIKRRDSTETLWINLKVYGTDTIQSPLGTFKCWKVGFSPEIRFYFWINEDGWPVQQGTGRPDMAYGRMNLLLVRREELP